METDGIKYKQHIVQHEKSDSQQIITCICTMWMLSIVSNYIPLHNSLVFKSERVKNDIAKSRFQEKPIQLWFGLEDASFNEKAVQYNSIE